MKPYMKLFQHLFIGLIALLCFPSLAQDNSKDNEALNNFYSQFVTAYTQLNEGVFEQLYATDASYIPEQQSKKITFGRDNIVELYRSFFNKIRNKKAHIQVDFRVIERRIDGNSATDVGYYLIHFYPPKETEEPMSEFAGKFVMVSKKKTDGKWYLSVDTSNRSDPNFYYNATPSPNLYYGSQFSTVKDDE